MFLERIETNPACTWKFTNTQISSKVDYAFQALSIDEPRASFRPALWERLDENTTTYLKQVWFPGSHANVGGGWYDQQVSCITLACESNNLSLSSPPARPRTQLETDSCNLPGICDQLTLLGIEFSPHRLTKLFIDSLRYCAAHPYPVVPSPSFFMPSWIWTILLQHRTPKPWASSPVPCSAPKPDQHRDTIDCTGKDHHPRGSPQELWSFNGRPWGLGQTRYPDSFFTVAAGTIVRRPGCFTRVDPDTNLDTDEPLLNTNERVHSCVRVRLACDGMGMDDRKAWRCAPLLQDDSQHSSPVWRLERARDMEAQQLARDEASWREEMKRPDEHQYGGVAVYEAHKGDGDWQWVFEEDAVVKNGVGHRVRPPVRVLPEEPMVGYWERHLLALTRGAADVWRLAESRTARAASPGKTA